MRPVAALPARILPPHGGTVCTYSSRQSSRLLQNPHFLWYSLSTVAIQHRPRLGHQWAQVEIMANTANVEMKSAEIEKIHAEISKLIAETAKINAEARWYPMVVVGTIFAAALALAKLLV